MIKTLRKIADWLDSTKCKLHLWWNFKLDSLKTNCECEKRNS